jgi:enoyl-CoA hydratase
VEPDEVLSRAWEVAAEAASTLNAGAHLASKLKARDGALNAIRAGIDGLAIEFAGS